MFALGVGFFLVPFACFFKRFFPISVTSLCPANNILTVAPVTKLQIYWKIKQTLKIKQNIYISVHILLFSTDLKCHFSVKWKSKWFSIQLGCLYIFVPAHPGKGACLLVVTYCVAVHSYPRVTSIYLHVLNTIRSCSYIIGCIRNKCK